MLPVKMQVSCVFFGVGCEWWALLRKNVLGEMIEKLTLTYNRTRQAVITRELIEIISGAAAV